MRIIKPKVNGLREIILKANGLVAYASPERKNAIVMDRDKRTLGAVLFRPEGPEWVPYGTQATLAPQLLQLIQDLGEVPE